GQELGVALLGHRLPSPEDSLTGAHRVFHRIDAAAKLLSTRGGDQRIDDDGRMIERAYQSAEGALACGGRQVDAGGLGLLHEVGEGENRVPGYNPLGFTPAQ